MLVVMPPLCCFERSKRITVPPAGCLGKPPATTIKTMDMPLIREEQLPLSCQPVVGSCYSLDSASFRSKFPQHLVETDDGGPAHPPRLFVASLFLSAFRELSEAAPSSSESYLMVLLIPMLVLHLSSFPLFVALLGLLVLMIAAGRSQIQR